MKRLLSVQDLSCVGKCSLTAALPVLAAMGVSCTPLPTAVFAAHTAFPNPPRIALTEQLSAFPAYFAAQDIRFDAVSVGYLLGQEQVTAALALGKTLGAPLLLDPAFGDHGKLYGGISRAQADAMRLLCAAADTVLPNITEAAYLTGLPYRADADAAYLAALADGLLALGARCAVITGVRRGDTVGFFGRVRGQSPFSYALPAVPGAFSGAGDLFAAVFAGARLLERTELSAASLAAEFVARCAQHTPGGARFGLPFERELGWLHTVCGAEACS